MLDTTTQTLPAEMPVESFKMSDYGPDRRHHGRVRVRMRAEARRIDNTLNAYRLPRFDILVLDIADGGISAASRMPVEPGERLTVLLPPESDLPTRIFGKVVRCRPRRDGWLLAIEFDHVPAA